MTGFWRDYMTGFLHGATFYPFPVMVPGGAFKGWSERKLAGHCAGILVASLAGTGAVVAVMLTVGP